jgi:hypothetical protein
MKECHLDRCALNHEGYCKFEDFDCDAKTDADLITEEEFEKQFGCKWYDY